MLMAIDHLSYHYYRINVTRLDCDSLIRFQYLPTLPVIIAEFGKPVIMVLAISGLLTILIFCIFIEQCYFLFHRIPLRYYCTTIGILAVFPISTLCFYLTMLMPRSHDVNTTMATLYQPLSLVLFYKLIVRYAGREKYLRTALLGRKIPINGPPFSWCCQCLPYATMNKKLYYLLKACIYQLFMAPCLLYFAMGVCTKTDVYVAGQFSLENAAIYIVMFGTLSFFIGIYCLEIFYKMSRILLPGYFIGCKYYVVQIFFVVTRFHVLIFDSLGNNGLLPCIPPISAFAFGLYIRTFLLIFFGFILSLWARYVFGRPLPVMTDGNRWSQPIS